MTEIIYEFFYQVLSPFIYDFDSWTSWEVWMFVATVFGIIVFFIKGGFSK